MTNNIIIVPDVHCRGFYKEVLNVKDKKVVFLGDYMDPYHYEGTTDEQGVENLKEIFDYARNNKNVTLLAGNHDCSWIWSWLGWERTHYEHYHTLHKLYRDNIDLLHPCLQVEDVLFTHAGVSGGWIEAMNRSFELEGSDFRLTKDNVIPYIENEFTIELKNDLADHPRIYGGTLRSPIFCVGRSRGGNAPYGGPFWSDFNYDYRDPENWNLTQIFSHTQREETGSVGRKGNGYCVDSRAIFEYDPKSQIISLWHEENSEKNELVK